MTECGRLKKEYFLTTARLPVPARVESTFTTTEDGTTPVRVLIVRSRLTPNSTTPFGVMRQEQQEMSCSSGENAYTFAQMFPAAPPKPGPSRGAPFATALTHAK